MTCLHRHARLSLRTFCAASTACGAVSLLRLSPLNFDFRLLPVRFGLTLRPARASDSQLFLSIRGRAEEGIWAFSFHFVSNYSKRTADPPNARTNQADSAGPGVRMETHGRLQDSLTT